MRKAFFTRIAAFAFSALAASVGATAATVRTATETFVTNKIAAALADARPADYDAVKGQVATNTAKIASHETQINARATKSALTTESIRAQNAERDLGLEIQAAEQRLGNSIENTYAVKVDKTTTVNGKNLSSNITLSASDVGALPVAPFANSPVANVPITDGQGGLMDVGMSALELVSTSGVYKIQNQLETKIASAAQSATNYTDAAIAAIPPPVTEETDPVWSAEKSGYVTTDALNTSDRLIFAIVQGTNIMDVVTNYDSQVNLPERYLVQIDTNGERRVIWRESTMLTNEIANAIAAYDAEVAAALDQKADTAWSKYTSGLGLPAPENTTWISTPETHIAGGFEYEKVITSSGSVWVLCSNGMDLNLGSSTNSYLEISAVDGTPIFRIEKTDSYLVGVDPSGISPVGSTVVVSVPAVNPVHPYARVSTNLTNAVWYKETAEGMPSGSPATVSWSGTSGAYVATIDFGASPQGFCYFEYEQEGETKIVNSGVTDLSGGLYFNGAKYMPADNNGVLEFRRVRGD